MAARGATTGFDRPPPPSPSRRLPQPPTFISPRRRMEALTWAPGLGGGGPSSTAARSPRRRSEHHGDALPTAAAGRAPSRGRRGSGGEKTWDPSPTTRRGCAPTARSPSTDGAVEACSDAVEAGGVLSSAPPRGGYMCRAPARWWPTGGGPLPVLFFLFLFVCRASQHRHTIEGVGRCLTGMLDAVWKGPPWLLFFPSWRTTKILNRAFRGRHTTNRLYREKNCRVPFVVRLGWKNARQSLCRAFSGLRRAPQTHGKAPVSRSEERVMRNFKLITEHIYFNFECY
jgi:hypothetical protein